MICDWYKSRYIAYGLNVCERMIKYYTLVYARGIIRLRSKDANIRQCTFGCVAVYFAKIT